jgi:hypothetical protein
MNRSSPGVILSLLKQARAGAGHDLDLTDLTVEQNMLHSVRRYGAVFG